MENQLVEKPWETISIHQLWQGTELWSVQWTGQQALADGPIQEVRLQVMAGQDLPGTSPYIWIQPISDLSPTYPTYLNYPTNLLLIQLISNLDSYKPRHVLFPGIDVTSGANQWQL